MLATPATSRRPGHPHLWLHLLLLVATFATTTMMGMRYAYNFNLGRPPISGDGDIFPFAWVVRNMASFATGLPFSLTLLGILLSHEFGHYIYCKRHGVKTSLPYLLPAPTLSGAAGAVIRLKSRIRSRMALLDIGVSGPIFGFLVAVPCTVAGLLLSSSHPATVVPSMVQFDAPLVMSLLRDLVALFRHDVPTLTDMVPHPILVASWVGLFITSLNLLPVGQLDGGHILYAVWPRAHKPISNLLIILLILGGAIYWVGWLLWAFLLMLPAMRHPFVPEDPPPARRQRGLAWAALAIFVLTALPTPFLGMSLMSIMQATKW